MNEITFEFIYTIFIKGHYDLDIITKKLDIHPSKTWVMDVNNRKPLYNQYSGWELSSKEIYGYIFAELFSPFYEEVEKRATIIQEIVADERISNRLDVVVGIHQGDIMPSLSLTKKHMQILSFIECDIDFDIYDYRSHK